MEGHIVMGLATAGIETLALKSEPKVSTKIVERLRAIGVRMKPRHIAAMASAFGIFCSASSGQDIAQFQFKQPNGVVRYSQPIMLPDRAAGENRIFNPTVIVVGDRLAMLYRVDAKGTTGTRIQLAFSDDGRNFIPDHANPVVVPDRPYDRKGCEDPRLVLFNGIYYLTYVGNMGSGETQCLATSTDLIHWEKRGVVLRPQGWNQDQAKAGVIVPEKIGGKYFMYFAGQLQPWKTSIGMAVSDDLLHWTQPLDHAVMNARADHFDSLGFEPGPPPIILPEGLLFIYNAWNFAHVHKTGWALFSKDDPSKLLKRCELPFIEPHFKYEIDGRHIFTFTEGTARFKGLWRFYYGAADKCIGLAEVDDIQTLLDKPKETPGTR
jgi:predicted GH43/DUF377 family glycosyl hydrolase